ncbi:MAG: type II toxin-antitoxin system death-on-curing family toxin [Patescibacteria group bacterium]|nr:type II toxin-antitoxin system death-on-curing family toxin [Patescibacteria group bacterium]
MRPKPLAIIEVEYIAFKMAEKLMIWDEPIPNFGSRFPNILESCLNQPFTSFNKKDLYRGIIGKASILFYLMIKNHPFQNGNKRIAVMSLLYFLYKNGKWFKIDNITLYRFAYDIAKSDPKDREEILVFIQKFIKKYISDL